jgi:hypothetical protein
MAVHKGWVVTPNTTSRQLTRGSPRRHPYPPFASRIAGPGSNDDDAAASIRRWIYIVMLLRAPFSAKLSVTWMLLIASMGPLIRQAAAAANKYAKKRTCRNAAEHFLAQAAFFTFVPLICLGAAFVMGVMVFAFVLALTQLHLIGIWLVLLFVMLFKWPVTVIFDKLGCEDDPVKYGSFEGRTRWLIWMSEGPTFKYYFTASLQVASVVLQFFVLAQAYASFESQVGKEAYERYLAPYGGLTARLYSDFFTLTNFRTDYALGSITFFFEWSMPDLGFPNLSFDIVLTQISQLSYMIGLGSLLLEKILSTAITILEKAPAVLEAAGKGAVKTVERVAETVGDKVESITTSNAA